jgi:hypothetical protein
LHESVRMSGRLAALSARPVFTVGESAYTWDDVLQWAVVAGTLDELRARTRRGLSLSARPDLKDGLEQGAVSAAATNFRRARRLLSAEELDAWLAKWELTVNEWGEHLERKLLIAAFPDEPDGEVAEEALEEAEYVDAVCSGLLEDEADAFAADAALADAFAEETEAERPGTIEETIAAATAARQAAMSDEGVVKEITRRILDWTRLELDQVELADEGAAREAAMCVRVDGRELTDVAADCHAPVEHVVAYVSDLEKWAQPLLLAAQAGDLVGPAEDDGRFVLFAVQERTAPSADDPELRARAEEALVQRAVKRATDSRVEWHDDV